MREQVIQAMVTAGIPAEKAAAHWQTFIGKVNDGDEPTAAGLSALKDAQIEAALPPIAAAAIIGALRGKSDKGKKYKSGKPYTATEFAEHYERTPDNADLLADIGRFAAGPWVIAPAGKFHVEGSARYLQWHIDDAIPPATINIDGTPVAPVFPGQERTKDEKLYYVDPFAPGEFLDVNMGSARTGADLSGYSDDALSALAFLYDRKLRQEGNLTLNRLANEMRGKAPAEILAAFSDVLAAWNTGKGRPPAKRAKRGERAERRPFVDAAPAMPAAALPERVSLTEEQVREVARITATLDRTALMSGFASNDVVYSLRSSDVPNVQAVMDVAALNRLRMRDGSCPLVTYLHTALSLLGGRREADIIRAILFPQKSNGVPLIYIVGARQEPSAARQLREHLAPYVHGGHVRVTSDTDVPVGAAISVALANKLSEATVIAFLTSAATLTELYGPPPGKPAIPVIVKSCMWEDAMPGYQPIPHDGKPVSEWADAAAALVNAAKGN